MSHARSRKKKIEQKSSTHLSTTLQALAVAAIVLIAIAYVAFSPNPNAPKRDPAPEFSVQMVNGLAFRLFDARGKVAILEFTRSNCSPCIQTENELLQVWGTYGYGVVIVSISIDPADTMQALTAYSQRFPWFWAKDDGMVVLGSGRIASLYQVRGTPTLFVIDPQGRIAFKHEGTTVAAQLDNEINSLQ